MACGDIICLQDARVIEHAVPLDLAVADNARIRGQSVEVIIDKRVYDLVVESGYAVEDMVFDPDGLRGRARVVDLAAAAVLPV